MGIQLQLCGRDWEYFVFAGNKAFASQNCSSTTGPQPTWIQYAFDKAKVVVSLDADVLGSLFGFAGAWGGIQLRSASPSLVVTSQTATPSAAYFASVPPGPNDSGRVKHAISKLH